MPNISNKAQFFILMAVILAGLFYILGKYINPYSFVDTSKYASLPEIFFFNNVRENAIKTVKITQQNNPNDLIRNLYEFKNYTEKVARENGYIIFIEYDNTTTEVSFNISLYSHRVSLSSSFIVPR
ncbi:MAG: hypothetical protein QXM38_00915 [Candidatus Aenigmatarchaeota archaeon]